MYTYIVVLLALLLLLCALLLLFFFSFCHVDTVCSFTTEYLDLIDYNYYEGPAWVPAFASTHASDRKYTSV